MELAFLARSLASSGDSKFKMLRVLNAPSSNYSEDYILKQVNLRYMALARTTNDPNSFYLHSSISLLWNLQTLTINWMKIVAPREIWEMPQLRHVNISEKLWLPDPPYDFVAMRNLQTLWRVVNLSEEVCKRIPNVKTLRVVYNEDISIKGSIALYDFGRLHKLESLECQFSPMPTRVDLVRKSLTFPTSLQELSLDHCYLHWEDSTMIGSLPHLRALRLGNKSVVGSEWNPVEGEFLCLRVLQLYNCEDLINWNADNSHFPLLEKLLLRYLANLNEIPSDFGEIPTLGEITLYECSDSLNISAVRILDQQESCGNEELGVKIGYWRREKLERFKEKIKQFESSTSNNLLFYNT